MRQKGKVHTLISALALAMGQSGTSVKLELGAPRKDPTQRHKGSSKVNVKRRRGHLRRRWLDHLNN